jgi:ubiquitin-conjugating enzyme E2 G1
MLMLNEPNIDSPANIDAAKQYRDDPENYRKKVRKLAQKSLDYM